MFLSKRPAALSLLALVLACSSDRQTGPSAIATNVHGFAAAKAAASIDTDSRARFTVYATMSDGTTRAGILGDGRLSDGSPAALGAPSEYQGNQCGVTAKIFWYNTKLSHSGDATFDPDASSATCGAPRKLGFMIGGTAQMIGPFTNVNQVMQLTTVGQSRTQAMTFDATGLANCGRIIFSQVNVTRLSGNTSGGKGTWTVESTSAGGCYRFSKGAYRYTGTSYTLPFHFLITEI